MGTIIDFIDSFNITVETVDRLVSTLDSLLPIQNRIPRYFFDDIFYDVRSFALTFQSELCNGIVAVYMTHVHHHHPHTSTIGQ